MTPPAAEPVQLARALRARLLPLLAVLALACSLGTPLGYAELRLGELRAEAGFAASQLGQLLSREVQGRSRLWRYDAVKLADHAKLGLADRQAGVLVRTADGDIDLGGGKALAHDRWAVWQSAPVALDAGGRGAVWVGLPTVEVWKTAAELLAFAAALALGTGWMLLHIATATARGAQDHIGELLAALEKHRDNLAAEVAAATAEIARQRADLAATAARALALHESERRAVAADLHDSVGQTLTALRLHVQALAAAPATPAAHPMILGQVDAAMDQLRSALRQLAPPVLTELGLQGALRRLADDMAAPGTLHVELACDLPARLNPAIELAAYRFAQEALTNAVRHARATAVQLTAEMADDRLRLVCRDDGCGFDPAHVALGLGLANMRQRVTLLGGTLAIDARPGAGTEIRAELPAAEELA